MTAAVVGTNNTNSNKKHSGQQSRDNKISRQNGRLGSVGMFLIGISINEKQRNTQIALLTFIKILN